MSKTNKGSDLNLIKIICGFLLTALFLTLSQWPFDLSALAWVGYLPLIFVSAAEVKKRYLILVGYLCCFAYWLVNLYWISLPTVAGYIAISAVLGLFWPLLAICVRYFRIRGWSLTFFFPILITGMETWQSNLFGGFGWRLMGHSMHHHLMMIQIADVFGVAGVTFVIGTVNGFISDMLLNKGRGKIIQIVFVIAVLCGTLLYGSDRLKEIKMSSYAGPEIAVVQSNEPLTVEGFESSLDEIFDSMVELSGYSLSAEPEMIVWPETMIPETLEPEYIELRGMGYRGYYFNDIISNLARYNKTYMVVGAVGGEVDFDKEEMTVSLKNRTNSAYIYGPDGELNKKRYDKINLVPFGEMVPFRDSVGWLYDFLVSFTPNPGRDYSLTAGKEYCHYQMVNGNNNYSFGVVICYEDTLARLVRKMVLEKEGNKTDKAIDWLINISNDGWFTRKLGNEEVYATTELAQHAIVCSFRAVENRIGIVRSVNTGISCFIAPSGEIVNGFKAGNLPAKALARGGVKGYIVDNVKVNNSLTVFSRYGQWLDFICGIFFIPAVIMSFGNFDKKGEL